MVPASDKKYWSLLLLAVLLWLHNPAVSLAQTITIYTIPAARSIKWESPGKLVKSYIANLFTRKYKGTQRHLIGHMIVELKDSSRHVIAGVSARKNAGMTRKVLFQRHGLGILLEKVDGVMEETDINQPDIFQRAKNGSIAFVEFTISQPAFERTWDYFTKYKERGYDHIYNWLNQPLSGKGAGCSAFAFSFLEVAGLSDMIPPEICRIERNIPADLAYLPGSKNRPVSLFRLLFSRKWAAANDAGALHYNTYEPTWLYNWIRANHAALPADGMVHKTWLKNAPGIHIDCRNRPVPQGSLWEN